MVMCPLLCVQSECFAVDHTNVLWFFHSLTSLEVKDVRFFLKNLYFKHNYAKLSDEGSAGTKNQLDIEKYPIHCNTL